MNGEMNLHSSIAESMKVVRYVDVEDMDESNIKELFLRIRDLFAQAQVEINRNQITSALSIYQQVGRLVDINPSKLAVNQDIPDSKPIQIGVLGKFSLSVDGVDPTLSFSSVSRPLELLKCLIALGGYQVNKYRIVSCLWPNSSGSDANNVFSTTLCRLREMLGYKQSIILKSGQVSINSDLANVDAWQLEKELDQIDDLYKFNHNNIDEYLQLYRKVKNSYRGDFLGEGFAYDWSIAFSEKLRRRMLNMYSNSGKYFMQHGKTDIASDCYEESILLDPLCESTYQHLIKVYLSQKKYSEAAHVYQECRKKLSQVLGVTPSQDTIKLYKNIQEFMKS